MNSLTLVLTLLIINLLISLGVLFWDIMKENGKMTAVHFIVNLLCPIIGPAYFLGSFILLKTSLRNKELTYSDIGFDSTRHVKKLKSDFLEEVDILPLEEAFSVSKTKDRRRALLTTLKKDYSKNISTVLLGLNNEDSETSHYAASVVLSTISDYLNLLSKLREAYLENTNIPGPALEYLDVLKEFMESNIIDKVDRRKYAIIYLETLDWLYLNFNENVQEEHYVFLIESMMNIDNNEAATKWSTRALRAFPENDSIYYVTMKMHYFFGNKDEFLALLDNIMTSNINISNQTLQTIRFFTYKPEKL